MEELALQEASDALEVVAARLGRMCAADHATLRAVRRALLTRSDRTSKGAPSGDRGGGRCDGSRGSSSNSSSVAGVSCLVVPADVLYLPAIASAVYDPAVVVARVRHEHAMLDLERRAADRGNTKALPALLPSEQCGADYSSTSFFLCAQISFPVGVCEEAEEGEGIHRQQQILSLLDDVAVLNRWLLGPEVRETAANAPVDAPDAVNPLAHHLLIASSIPRIEPALHQDDAAAAAAAAAAAVETAVCRRETLRRLTERFGLLPMAQPVFDVDAPQVCPLTTNDAALREYCESVEAARERMLLALSVSHSSPRVPRTAAGGVSLPSLRFVSEKEVDSRIRQIFKLSECGRERSCSNLATRWSVEAGDEWAALRRSRLPRAATTAPPPAAAAAAAALVDCSGGDRGSGEAAARATRSQPHHDDQASSDGLDSDDTDTDSTDVDDEDGGDGAPGWRAAAAAAAPSLSCQGSSPAHQSSNRRRALPARVRATIAEVAALAPFEDAAAACKDATTPQLEGAAGASPSASESAALVGGVVDEQMLRMWGRALVSFFTITDRLEVGQGDGQRGAAVSDGSGDAHGLHAELRRVLRDECERRFHTEVAERELRNALKPPPRTKQMRHAEGGPPGCSRRPRSSSSCCAIAADLPDAGLSSTTGSQQQQQQQRQRCKSVRLPRFVRPGDNVAIAIEAAAPSFPGPAQQQQEEKERLCAMLAGLLEELEGARRGAVVEEQRAAFDALLAQASLRSLASSTTDGHGPFARSVAAAMTQTDEEWKAPHPSSSPVLADCAAPRLAAEGSELLSLLAAGPPPDAANPVNLGAPSSAASGNAEEATRCPSPRVPRVPASVSPSRKRCQRVLAAAAAAGAPPPPTAVPNPFGGCARSAPSAAIRSLLHEVRAFNSVAGAAAAAAPSSPPAWLTRLNLSALAPAATPDELLELVDALLGPQSADGGEVGEEGEGLPSSAAVLEMLVTIDVLRCPALHCRAAVPPLLRLIDAAANLRHLVLDDALLAADADIDADAAGDAEGCVSALYDAMDRKAARRAVDAVIARIRERSVATVALRMKGLGDDDALRLLAALEQWQWLGNVDGASEGDGALLVRTIDLGRNLVTDGAARALVDGCLCSSRSPVCALLLDGNACVSEELLSEAAERSIARKRHYLSHGRPALP